MAHSKKVSTDHDRSLSQKQLRGLEVLLVGGSDQQAAEAAGVSRSTMHRWRHDDPGFALALAAARNELLGRTTARLHAATAVAVRALEEVAKDSRFPAARVAAARAIMELSLRAIEVEELTKRIEELERRFEEEPQQGYQQ